MEVRYSPDSVRFSRITTQEVCEDGLSTQTRWCIDDIEYYLKRPRTLGDFHGQAPFLWLTSQRLEK